MNITKHKIDETKSVAELLEKSKLNNCEIVNKVIGI
jgi:hypothetical protein